MHVKDYLKEALNCIEDRAASRDTNEERAMGRCIAAFNAATGHNLSEKDGNIFMVMLKIARDYNGEVHRDDDFIDGCAYMAFAGEAATSEDKKRHTAKDGSWEWALQKMLQGCAVKGLDWSDDYLFIDNKNNKQITSSTGCVLEAEAQRMCSTVDNYVVVERNNTPEPVLGSWDWAKEQLKKGKVITKTWEKENTCVYMDAKGDLRCGIMGMPHISSKVNDESEKYFRILGNVFKVKK